jgi:parvulin-like peptidyl-prolyl isomerase
VAQQFGEEFAAAILTAAAGQWAGPVRSGYGVHVVYVRERVEGRLPVLADVRPLVERELTADRRRRQLDAMYARLLERYRVVVEKPGDVPRVEEAAPAGSGGGQR